MLKVEDVFRKEVRKFEGINPRTKEPTIFSKTIYCSDKFGIEIKEEELEALLNVEITDDEWEMVEECLKELSEMEDKDSDTCINILENSNYVLKPDEKAFILHNFVGLNSCWSGCYSDFCLKFMDYPYVNLLVKLNVVEDDRDE